MRVAVIGQGSAGRRHAELILQLGHDAIVFDPSATSAVGAERAPSLESAVAGASAVIVASPNSMHRDHAVAALERGRHVLVEKPLATTAAAAAEVAATARAAGLVCAVAMNWRFHWAVVGLRRLLQRGDLGRPLMATASFGYDLRRWRPGSDYRQSYSAKASLGGGIVLDAIHEIDYLLWLLGPVRSVMAETGQVSGLDVDVEDVAVAAIRFESGAIAALDLNFFEPAYRRGAILVGEDASAHWDFTTSRLTVKRGEKETAVAGEPRPLAETYRDEVTDFIASTVGEHPPRTTSEEGVAAVAIADAIKESARTGSRILVPRS